jgi:hypothetical protein
VRERRVADGFCRHSHPDAALRARLHDHGQVGLPAVADAADSGADFVGKGLAALGIEVDETELALAAVTHGVFWGPIQELLALDLAGVEPERRPDYSRAP